MEGKLVHRDVLPDGDQVTLTQDLKNKEITLTVDNPKDPSISNTGHGDQSYNITYKKGTGKKADTLETDEGYYNQTGPEGDDWEIDFNIHKFNEKTVGHDTGVLRAYKDGVKTKKNIKYKKDKISEAEMDAVGTVKDSPVYDEAMHHGLDDWQKRYLTKKKSKLSVAEGPEPDLDAIAEAADDYAKGGRVSYTKGGLAHVLGV